MPKAELVETVRLEIVVEAALVSTVKTEEVALLRIWKAVAELEVVCNAAFPP